MFSLYPPFPLQGCNGRAEKGSQLLAETYPSIVHSSVAPRLLRMIAHQWQNVQSQSLPQRCPGRSREEFRVSAATRATGTSLVGGEVLPFTSPYLEEWELLGKRWRALPEAERLQYKIAKVASSSDPTLGPPTTTLSSSAEASVSLLLDLCPKPLSTLAQTAQRLVLRRSCSWRRRWRA